MPRRRQVRGEAGPRRGRLAAGRPLPARYSRDRAHPAGRAGPRGWSRGRDGAVPGTGSGKRRRLRPPPGEGGGARRRVGAG